MSIAFTNVEQFVENLWQSDGEAQNSEQLVFNNIPTEEILDKTFFKVILRIFENKRNTKEFWTIFWILNIKVSKVAACFTNYVSLMSLLL